MNTKPVVFCAALLLGAILALGVRELLQRPKDAARAAASQRALVEAQEEARRLQQKLDDFQRETNRLDLEKCEALIKASEIAAKNDALTEEIQRLRGGEVEAPAPTGPPTEKEILKAIGEFGEALGEIMQGGGDEAKAKLRELFARAGQPAVDLLVGKFEDDATDIGLRVVIAHALAQSGDGDAVASLTDVLADPEAGMLELRLASHGLAFSDAEGIDDALLAVAHKTADTGARANAAFGLARRGHPEGVGLYLKATDEALANRDPAALQYLGGFMLLGDDALPPLRERLLTYTEAQASLTLIEILKAKGDKGALENLRQLAADEGRPASTRRAAEGAIKVLEAAGN